MWLPLIIGGALALYWYNSYFVDTLSDPAIAKNGTSVNDPLKNSGPYKANHPSMQPKDDPQKIWVRASINAAAGDKSSLKYIQKHNLVELMPRRHELSKV